MTLETVVFDKDYLTIYLDADHKLIHLKWKGHVSSEHLREALNFALEIVQEHQVEFWLGDLKMMQAILPIDEAWTNQNWIPRLVKTGIRRMAIVTSLDYLNNMSVRRTADTAAPISRYETRFFVDVVEAKDWLVKD